MNLEEKRWTEFLKLSFMTWSSGQLHAPLALLPLYPLDVCESHTESYDEEENIPMPRVDSGLGDWFLGDLTTLFQLQKLQMNRSGDGHERWGSTTLCKQQIVNHLKISSGVTEENHAKP